MSSQFLWEWCVPYCINDSIRYSYLICLGRDTSVGIATYYGLDGPGSNPGGGGVKIFTTRPDRPWGPPSLL
jgi:hypothetical protein